VPQSDDTLPAVPQSTYDILTAVPQSVNTRISSSFNDFACTVMSMFTVVGCEGVFSYSYVEPACSASHTSVSCDCNLALDVGSHAFETTEIAEREGYTGAVHVISQEFEAGYEIGATGPDLQLSDGYTRVSRKRIRKVTEWKSNKRKHLKNHGMEHVTGRGDVVPAKAFTSSDKCCRLKCALKVTEEDRRAIFKGFWELGSHDAQSTFIAGCVQQDPVSVHRVSTAEPGTSRVQPREFARKYTLPVPSGDVRVCKTTFLSVLDVSTGRVDRVLRSAKLNGGVTATDRRGKYVHSKQCIPTNAREAVVEHIKSFPANESHYTRAHSESKRYLSSDLTVSTMYNLHVERCTETGVAPVKQWYYRHIFNTQFNLSFHPPRKDTCKRCDVYKVQLAAAEADSDKTKISALKAEHELHLRKAEAVRALMHVEENSSPEHEAFTFDLQKVLSLPRLTTNEVYYCRQLSVYNLGIHSLTSKKSTLNVWDETMASRGAVDIGSCLVKYCLEKAESGVKTLSVFSDSCGGQNRNHKLTLLWMHVCSVSNIEVIDHRFMVSGHSYLPNDADFGIIERATDKCSELYVPDQWCGIIEKCNQKNPFTVVRMQREMFVSVAEMLKCCTLRKTSSDGQKVEWLKMQWLQVRKAEPLKLYFKYSVQDDIPFSCVDFAKKGRAVKTDVLTHSYVKPRALTKEKVTDLQKLLKYIPPVHHAFYQERMASVAVSNEPSDETDFQSDGDDNGVQESPGILSENCSGEVSVTSARITHHTEADREAVTPLCSGVSSQQELNCNSAMINSDIVTPASCRMSSLRERNRKSGKRNSQSQAQSEATPASCRMSSLRERNRKSGKKNGQSQANSNGIKP
jgi:hypothetical protein